MGEENSRTHILSALGCHKILLKLYVPKFLALTPFFLIEEMVVFRFGDKFLLLSIFALHGMFAGSLYQPKSNEEESMWITYGKIKNISLFNGTFDINFTQPTRSFEPSRK